MLTERKSGIAITLEPFAKRWTFHLSRWAKECYGDIASVVAADAPDPANDGRLNGETTAQLKSNVGELLWLQKKMVAHPIYQRPRQCKGCGVKHNLMPDPIRCANHYCQATKGCLPNAISSSDDKPYIDIVGLARCRH